MGDRPMTFHGMAAALAMAAAPSFGGWGDALNSIPNDIPRYRYPSDWRAEKPRVLRHVAIAKAKKKRAAKHARRQRRLAR